MDIEFGIRLWEQREQWGICYTRMVCADRQENSIAYALNRLEKLQELVDGDPLVLRIKRKPKFSTNELN